MSRFGSSGCSLRDRLERSAADALAPLHDVRLGESRCERLRGSVAGVPLAFDDAELLESRTREERVLTALAVGLDPDESLTVRDLQRVLQCDGADLDVGSGCVRDPR